MVEEQSLIQIDPFQPQSQTPLPLLTYSASNWETGTGRIPKTHCTSLLFLNATSFTQPSEVLPLSYLPLMKYPSTLCIFLGSAQFFISHHIYLCEFTFSPPKRRHLEDRVNFEIVSVTSCLAHTKNSIFVPWVNNCLIRVGKK